MEGERLRYAEPYFRHDLVTGIGCSEMTLDDPVGNPIELSSPSINSAVSVLVYGHIARETHRAQTSYDIPAEIDLPPAPADARRGRIGVIVSV